MVDEKDARLPIFPLPAVVLFPRVRVPLHVFEPRYRAMTRSALDGGRRIGLVAVPEQHQAEMSGDPPVFPVGCEGRIEQAEKLPDGRYNLVLEGVARFRIIEEPPRPEGQLFRSVLAERLVDPSSDEILASVRSRRDEVVDLLLRLLERVAPNRAQSIDRARIARIDDETFVNAIAQAVDFPVADKQSLLEANGVSDRCDQLVALLRFSLAEHDAGTPSDRGLLH